MIPKFEHTQNNHFRWGFGDDWHNDPDPEKQYKIHLGYATRPVMSFREECINAAKLIAEKTTKPIVVGLSGGSDSQMVCLAFREAGIPFKAIIVSMFDGGKMTNEYDIKTAYEFCKKYGIEYMESFVGLEGFYKTKGVEYAAKYGSASVAVEVQTSTMDFLGKDYCYIMAGGDIMFHPYQAWITPDIEQPLMPFTNGKLTVPCWWQKPQPILQHMIASEYEGTSKFFLYTPELILSYLKDPAVQDFLNIANHGIPYPIAIQWLKGKDLWKLFQMIIKPMMTMREWPEMIPARKYTGFEKLQKMRDRTDEESRYELYEKMLSEADGGKTAGQVVAIPIVDLIKYVETPHTEPLYATKLLPWKKILKERQEKEHAANEAQDQQDED